MPDKYARAALKSINSVSSMLVQLRTGQHNLEPKLEKAMVVLCENALAMASIVLDLAHLLQAQAFQGFATHPESYSQTVYRHAIVLLASFDEKINTVFLGKRMQEALSEIGDIGQEKKETMENLRRALKSYNRLIQPYRSSLLTIRNTVGAHRDISHTKIQNTTKELTTDFIVLLIKAVFILHTAFSQVATQALHNFAMYLIATRDKRLPVPRANGGHATN